MCAGIFVCTGTQISNCTHFYKSTFHTCTHTRVHTEWCQKSRQMHGDRPALRWINTLSVPHVRVHHCSHEHFRHISLSWPSLFQSLSLSLITSTSTASCRVTQPSTQPVSRPANIKLTALTPAHQCTCTRWQPTCQPPTLLSGMLLHHDIAVKQGNWSTNPKFCLSVRL